jgi:vitamin B12 transporter
MNRYPLMIAASAACSTFLMMSTAFGTEVDGAGLAGNAVLVTATREPESVFDSLSSVILIDHDTIERSLATDVGDLLRLHAGLDVARSGGPGQSTSVFIRGANSNHTVLLIDGVRINPGTLGQAAVQNIAPELIDHIEIVKGPRSTLYGTDAIGGVINVITRRPEGTGLEAAATVGRYDTREGTAEGHYGGTAGAVSAAVHWIESAGFPQQTNDTTDRGYRNVSTALAARTEINGVELGARVWHARGNTQYYDGYASPVDQDQNFQNSSFAVNAASQVTQALYTRLLLSQIVDDLRQAQTPDYSTTRRHSLDWQNGLDLGAQQLTFGALLTRENARSSVYGTNFDVDTRSDTWFAEDQLTIGAHRLLAAVGYTRHETFGTHATWNGEYGYAPTASTLLLASFGTAFRAPDSTDRYGYGGNPALKPESARNLEFGIHQRIGARQMVTVAAFENRIDDLVQFALTPTADNPYNGINENVARARIQGLEATWEYASDDWQARVEGSRQNPINREDNSDLLRRARQSATLAVGHRIGAQNFGLDVVAVGGRADIDQNGSPVRVGGYALLNLGWRTTIAPGLNLLLKLDNALDKRYELISNFRTARRSLLASVRYVFH